MHKKLYSAVVAVSARRRAVCPRDPIGTGNVTHSLNVCLREVARSCRLLSDELAQQRGDYSLYTMFDVSKRQTSPTVRSHHVSLRIHSLENRAVCSDRDVVILTRTVGV